VDNESSSSAFYAQRLRLKTIFQVTEGLRLTTRCDIMEKVWGADRVNKGPVYGPESDGPGYYDDEENIDFDRVYVSFDVPVGTFHVGYMARTAGAPSLATIIAQRPGSNSSIPPARGRVSSTQRSTARATSVTTTTTSPTGIPMSTTRPSFTPGMRGMPVCSTGTLMILVQRIRGRPMIVKSHVDLVLKVAIMISAPMSCRHTSRQR